MRWDVDPIIVELGPLELRWYGLFFAFGLLLAARAYPRIFARRGLAEEHAQRLTLWLPVGMILGAHLVHLIFYEPRSFIEQPQRIIEIGKGLSSHGGALGAVVALLIYVRRRGLDLHRYLDASLIGAIWIFPWVRIGNFFNSEIYGKPTDLPWGVVFALRQPEARHPTQLYEALGGFALLWFAYWLDRNYRARLRDGATFYLLTGTYFVGRFLVEYLKAYQVLDPGLPLTMGQCLSLPVVALSAYMLLASKDHNIRTARPKESRDTTLELKSGRNGKGRKKRKGGGKNRRRLKSA
ncbi:MAG: prolipoprotein diacylglyceryl transferase [Proteobacteria bacterium]|nr:prolipoprotein diacylglyceryl transferase [Pseudomonadota bacterium]